MIRRATAGDAAALGALLADVFADTYGHAIPAGTLKAYLARTFSPSVVASLLQDPHAPCWVHDEAGLRGCAWLMPGREPGGDAQIELGKLYVRRDMQGRRTGAQLLGAACAWARAHGQPAIWLAAWRENTRAITFYQRHGFAISGSTEVWVDDVRFDDVVMRLALDARGA